LLKNPAGTESPYHEPVARLESWLNRQHGWRLAVLLWALFLPYAATTVLGAWNLFSDSGRVLLESGIASLVASALGAGLAAAARDRQVKERAKPMIFSWAGVALYLIFTAFALSSAAQQIDGPGYFHRIVAAVMLLLIASGGALLLVARVRHQRLAGPVRHSSS
jgi:hypothetical protein